MYPIMLLPAYLIRNMQSLEYYGKKKFYVILMNEKSTYLVTYA